ncbi:DUF421 domain-containing protein [Ursidibacter arcticus]
MADTFLIYILALFKILLGFFIVIFYFKLSKKAQTMQFTPIEFIGNIILGGIIGEVIYNPEISFITYIITLISALAVISLLNFVTTKFMPVRKVMMASVTPVIVNGKFQLDSLNNKENKFDIIEFTAMLRSNGIFSLEDVEFAQIEAHGGLTVIKKGEGYLNFLLVKGGQILHTQLEKIGKDEAWLLQQLKVVGIEQLDDIFLVEFSQNRRFYIVNNDGTSLSSEING